MRDDSFDYDVCLSFAGEQRDYVDAVAAGLRDRGVRVFYDEYERVELWGKDLYEHLDYIYQRAARYCVLFASADYADKMWTSHERRSAQARAIEENKEYILPARFDDTEIPGLRDTVGYISLSDTEPDDLADLIKSKVSGHIRKNYLPPVVDILADELELPERAVLPIAATAFRNLKRTTPEERELLVEIFRHGCVSEWPENIHINLDLVRRDLGMPPAETLEALKGLGTVGFHIEFRANDDHEGDVIEVRWLEPINREDDPEMDEISYRFGTAIMGTMLRGPRQVCTECWDLSIGELNFSGLSSASLEPDAHGSPTAT